MISGAKMGCRAWSSGRGLGFGFRFRVRERNAFGIHSPLSFKQPAAGRSLVVVSMPATDGPEIGGQF